MRLTRIIKHRWQSDEATQRAVPPALLKKLAALVKESEFQHSGEIRIFVEAGLPLSYLWRNSSTREITRARALAMFGKLRVWDTANNNGVLIYLLLAERSIEIVADRGVNERVASDTWSRMIKSMSTAFKSGDFDGGLTLAVQEISLLLLKHFPLQPGQMNQNELPDDPMLG